MWWNNGAMGRTSNQSTGVYISNFPDLFKGTTFLTPYTEWMDSTSQIVTNELNLFPWKLLILKQTLIIKKMAVIQVQV